MPAAALPGEGHTFVLTVSLLVDGLSLCACLCVVACSIVVLSASEREGLAPVFADAKVVYTSSRCITFSKYLALDVL